MLFRSLVSSQALRSGEGLAAFLSVPNSAWARCLSSLSQASKHNLLVVHSRERPSESLQEALRLAETFTGSSCPHVVVGSAQHFQCSPSTYFGSGTIAELAKRTEELQAQKVFINVQLNGVQLRNLEDRLGCPVVDRLKIIIDIFGQRARTREAKLQVEMASLDLRASRLVRSVASHTGQRAGFGEEGATEVVSARQRGRSGSSSGGLGGAAGGGDSELQLQRSRIRARIRALKAQLVKVQRTRSIQRTSRQRDGVPSIAVVGYTNAGKSSLVSSLSRRDISVEDRLFETLDTTTRRVMLPSGRTAVLTDTVGFISELPTQLIKAFRATLEEVLQADLLLHVLDASSPNVNQQRLVVLNILTGMGMPHHRINRNVIEVWNKADVLASKRNSPSQPLLDAVSSSLGNQYQQATSCPTVVLTSATTRLGLPELLAEIDRKVAVQCATEEVKAGLARMGPRMLVQSLVGPAFPPAMMRNMWKQGVRGLSENSKHRQRQAIWQH
ncbi:hypothetical protein WJX73_001336 [Symbiochloris irregularis]|uniref:Hflx-type G domain-containing protein n=1 Tax=Symbiochloris irregularis TaxID=706552 RepID=A0AAW1PVH6_9CHLO